MLKVGFGRVDITPSMGVDVPGYFNKRSVAGVLDPLLATAVVFDDGKNRAVIVSADTIGMNDHYTAVAKKHIAEACSLPQDAIFLHATHTHTGGFVCDNDVPAEAFEMSEYGTWLVHRLADATTLAINDLAEAKMSYTRGRVEDVAFVRRFRMKDGTVMTNPGWQNPDIDHALGTPDEESRLLIIKREGKPEIGIVNYQVHPDVIGGEFVSADFPGFVRRTYEENVPNSLCMYINGTQGDTNHVDVRRLQDTWSHGYLRSEYMGKKIAFSVLSNYNLAEELSGDKVNFAEKTVTVKYNKGKPEEVEPAMRLAALYYETGSEAAALPDVEPFMRKVELVAEACRIERLMNRPDYKELTVSALSVGDVVFAGFPGEPFTDIGRAIRKNSKFTLTMPVCCVNGYEGYYPTEQAFSEGGYETLDASFACGTAEKLLEASTEIVNSL